MQKDRCALILSRRAGLLIIHLQFKMPRVQFRKEQRALIAKVYSRTKSYVEVKRRFCITFSQSRVPCSSTIYRIKEKFKQTGTVHNLNKDGSGRPRTARTRRYILTPFIRHWQEILKSARKEILYQTDVSQLSTGSQGKISKSTHIRFKPVMH